MHRGGCSGYRRHIYRVSFPMLCLLVVEGDLGITFEEANSSDIRNALQRTTFLPSTSRKGSALCTPLLLTRLIVEHSADALGLVVFHPFELCVSNRFNSSLRCPVMRKRDLRIQRNSCPRGTLRSTNYARPSGVRGCRRGEFCRRWTR